MGCGFGPEFCYSLVASCGVAGLFSTRPRVCVEWVGDSFGALVGVGVVLPRHFLSPGVGAGSVAGRFCWPPYAETASRGPGSRRGARARRL